MRRIIIGALAGLLLLAGAAGAAGTARADNGHCLGQSGNVGLPNHHHVNDFGGCH